MLSFGTSHLNWGIFARSLAELSLRPWAVVVIPEQALGVKLAVILINCF